MKLIRALAGVLALASATFAHAATVVVSASVLHLCLNVHDQDASQVVSAMKAAGLGCYRKDATGAPLKSALAAAGLKGDFILPASAPSACRRQRPCSCRSTRQPKSSTPPSPMSSTLTL